MLTKKHFLYQQHFALGMDFITFITDPITSGSVYAFMYLLKYIHIMRHIGNQHYVCSYFFFLLDLFLTISSVERQII